MKAVRSTFVVAVLSGLLLGACATPDTPPAELRTASDQTENEKRARIRLQLAVGYYEQRQMEVALDEVKKALNADPKLADAYSMRALIYMEMNQNRLAEENFLQALRLSPNHSDYQNNYGWFLCRNGKERQAIDYFGKAVQTRALGSATKALNNAGVCSLKLNDRAAAEKYFNQAFQAEPGNLQTNLHLARFYYDQGDYQRARFYAKRLIKAEALTAEVLWLAIRIERKLGDRVAEGALATQLRRRHPGSAEYAAYERGAFNE